MSLGNRSTIVLLIILLVSVSAIEAVAEPPITLGIFPRRNLQETANAYAPLADYLTAKLGRRVELKLTPDFQTFWRGVSQQQYDLVHYNQYQYVRSHKEAGYRVILMNEESGSTTIRTTIVVRKDSGLTTLSDLSGKRIVFGGDRQAMVSYIGAHRLLKQAGLLPGSYQEQFASNPRNVVFSVFTGLADAGGIGDTTLQLPSVKAKIDVTQLRVLATGETLPMLCWAVSKDLPAETLARIKNAMTTLKSDPRGPPILSGIEATDLVPAEDRDYDVIRVIVKEVLGEAY